MEEGVDRVDGFGFVKGGFDHGSIGKADADADGWVGSVAGRVKAEAGFFLFAKRAGEERRIGSRTEERGGAKCVRQLGCRWFQIVRGDWWVDGRG